jgi:hypothetical protein
MSVYNLIQYTPLLELWEIFEDIISLSPLDAHGFFTLSQANDYMKDYPNSEEEQFARTEFWKAMSYFLNRKNQDIVNRRDAKRRRDKK